MIHRVSCALATAMAVAGAARAQAPSDDPAVRALLAEAAAASPEVAQARTEVEAWKERVPQAGALPDPSLTLGIQNDGFTRIAIGEMDTSFFNIMVTQPLPWPGKRGLREQVVSFDVRQAEARLSRALLDLEGRVLRARLSLQLTRGQLELLTEQEELWAQAEQTARTRYESGQVPQSDLLRAQLERSRLQQRRWALEADAATRLAELNRLRARPLDEPLPSVVALREVSDPLAPTEAAAQADAEARSPELLLATLSVEQAGSRVDLARKEQMPDLAVAAAVMPRGSLPPMWSLNVSIGLPIFSGSKQARAVDESVQRRLGERHGAETTRQILRLRTRQRLEVLSALNRSNEHYRRQTLVLSGATAQATLAQYEVGRTPFASVLEALGGYIADRSSYLSSQADAQLVAIARHEVSLDAVPALGGGLSAAAMPNSAAPAGAAPSAQAANPMAGAAQQRAPGGM